MATRPIRRVDEQITPLLNEVKPSECAVPRHQNERVHSNVHQAVIQYVQFTFAPKYERVHELSFNERVQAQHCLRIPLSVT